ncbi:MAG TPA: dTMP kinase [Planctomycetota bacterium]|nr:dTMP kinase [Planctomycetota bacterium]
MRGRFLVLDGPDGSGKSTQIARLAAKLRDRGESVLVLREPGATPMGEAIRDLLLHADVDITPLAEMLLYQAARAHLVETVVRPALAAGQTVLLDRYWYSTAAYQGHGLGLDPGEIRRVSAVATKGLEPDLLLLLDVPADVGLARLKGARDKVEARSLGYHRRVRDGFLLEARRLGAMAVVVDASRDEEAVFDDVWRAVEARR